MGLVVALTVAGCSDPSQDNDSSGDNDQVENTTINAYLYQAPRPNLSPMAPGHGPDGIVMTLIYDSLLGSDAEFNLTPRLAGDMPEVSEDGLTITYKLREGLTWSDGEPLTAEDVVFTYNLMVDPDTGSAYSAAYAGVEGAADVIAGKVDEVSGFSAPDDLTFQIKLTKPDIGFVSQTSGVWILPKHILGDVPRTEMTDHEFFTKSPDVGAGPYTFVEYKTDQFVHLTKNPNYRSDVNIDEVYLRPVTSDVATQQLGTGEMDIVQISPADIETVEAMDNIEVTSEADAGFIRLTVNQSKPHLQDKRLRQAMLYAIDREQLINEALEGRASLLNTSFMGNARPEEINDYPYDPQKAKDLLKDINWDPNQEIEIVWVPGQRDRDIAATVVESQLNAAGIKVKLRKVQPGELTELLDSNGYDMVLFGGGNYKTDPSKVYPIDGCDVIYPNGGNLSKWCNQEFDRLMKEANTTVDEAKRIDLYQRAARIENEEVPYIWLFRSDTIWAYNTRIEGFVASGSPFSQFVSIQDWTIAPE